MILYEWASAQYLRDSGWDYESFVPWMFGTNPPFMETLFFNRIIAQYLGIDEWNSNPIIAKQKATPRPVLIHLLKGGEKKPNQKETTTK